MAKILLVMRGDINAKNGSAFHLRNMIECVTAYGHQFEILHCPDGPSDGPLCDAEIIKFRHMMATVNPDVVLADYSWMCSAFAVISSNIKKICFVHDLRCRIIPCLEKIGYKDTFGWNEEKEGRLLRKADILLVLNKDDEALCRILAPAAKMVRIGISMKPIEHDVSKEIMGRCIYVCSSNEENKFACEWFLKEVWPKVKAQVPHATLTAVIGFSEDIDKYYAEAQVVIVPHIMLGGLKIKTAEAFAHGVPVIGNTCSFDGFEVAGNNDPESMAKELVDFFTKDSFRKYLIAGAIDRQSDMTEKSAYGQLLDVLA